MGQMLQKSKWARSSASSRQERERRSRETGPSRTPAAMTPSKVLVTDSMTATKQTTTVSPNEETPSRPEAFQCFEQTMYCTVSAGNLST